MKKEFIIATALIVSIIILICSLLEFKNPIHVSGNIEENYFIITIGIDKGIEDSKNYRITTIAEKFGANSSNSSSGQSKIADVVTIEGTTILEAITKIALFKDKSLFLGHMKYILISEDIAKENVLDILDFFIRNNELRMTTTIVIVKNTSAEAFIRVGEDIKIFTTDLLDGAFHNVGELSISEKVKLSNIIQTFNNTYADVYIPAISLFYRDLDKVEVSSKKESSSEGLSGLKEEGIVQEGNNLEIGKSLQKVGSSEGSSSGKSSSGESSSGESSSGESGSSKKTEEPYINLDGFATFKGTKLIGYISGFTARGLNWMNSKVESSIIVLKDDNDKKISVKVASSNSKIKINMNGDVPEATVKIKFVTFVAEVMSQEDIFKKDKLKKLEEQQNDTVKKEVESMLDYAKKNDIDITKISDEIYHQYPLKWDNIKDKWKEIFKTMKINVDVESNINKSYNFIQPIISKSGESK
ncbi:MAG: Ger(x)C family spore germination C-terminal domain-containing protein [Clostridia bacterium]|nr:Ger(x)C family spore germination C-terminal domain-containing protein [Clostridia bacterium]MDD4386401.1 Ger(x)C family spore germination C-terminal domain-containing protein [Clostridia bacterium]